MNKWLVQAWIARAQFLPSTTASSITTTGGILCFGRSVATWFCFNKLFEERMSKIFIPETSLSETGRLTASLQNAVVPWRPTGKMKMKVVEYCKVISLVCKMLQTSEHVLCTEARKGWSDRSSWKPNTSVQSIKEWTDLAGHFQVIVNFFYKWEAGFTGQFWLNGKHPYTQYNIVPSYKKIIGIGDSSEGQMLLG